MKIAVIGLGAVGTEIVGVLSAMPEVAEIVCVNRTMAKAEGEIMDLLHAAPFAGAVKPRLRVGRLPDIENSDIVVVAVGAMMPPSMVRDDSLQANHAIIRDLVPGLTRYAPEAIVLVVTNPVDVIAQLILEYTCFARQRVISLGTLVDTARLIHILQARTGIDAKNISAYVLGDHSETGFIAWNACTICGMELDTFCRKNGLPLIDRAAVRQEVFDAPFSLLRKKGSSTRAIAASVCRVVRAIATDEKSILPVGVLLEGEYGVDGLVMSVPCVIGEGGAERVLRIDLAAPAIAEFTASESHLRRTLAAARTASPSGRSSTTRWPAAAETIASPSSP